MLEFLGILGLGLLALMLVPVGIKRASPAKQRQFHGTHLQDMQYQEVRFPNAAQNINLAGLLFVPEGEGAFPLAIIIHGSGSSNRANAWYLSMIQYLQAQGIAVLLPDKRGSEQSEGNWRNSSFEDLATDTLAAIDYVKQQASVNVSSIGIIGMSQGGCFAPLVANQSSDLAFMISVVGAAVMLHEQLQYEETCNLREMGFLPGIANMIAYASTYHLRHFRQADFWNAVGNFDPLPYWKKLRVPALVLYGEDDTNVPSRTSAKRLAALNKADVIIYEGSGHALEDPIGSGDRIFREDALATLVRFIKEHSSHTPL